MGFVDVPIIYMTVVWWRTVHPPLVVGPAATGELETIRMTSCADGGHSGVQAFLFAYLLLERSCRCAGAKAGNDRPCSRVGVDDYRRRATARLGEAHGNGLIGREAENDNCGAGRRVAVNRAGANSKGCWTQQDMAFADPATPQVDPFRTAGYRTLPDLPYLFAASVTVKS